MSLLGGGGGGRAYGLGGPNETTGVKVAPGETMLDALEAAPGEKGGSTIPDGLVVCDPVSVDGFRGDAVSAAALPPVSEAPSGICTFSRGRDPALLDPAFVIMLFVRVGTVNVVLFSGAGAGS
jgi:hypothetical protein